MLEFAELRGDRRVDARIRVAEQIDPPGAHRIEVAAAVEIVEPRAVAARDGHERQRFVQLHLRARMPDGAPAPREPVGIGGRPGERCPVGRGIKARERVVLSWMARDEPIIPAGLRAFAAPCSARCGGSLTARRRADQNRPMAGDGTAYTSTAIALHWLAGVLILCGFALGVSLAGSAAQPADAAPLRLSQVDRHHGIPAGRDAGSRGASRIRRRRRRRCRHGSAAPLPPRTRCSTH